MDELLMTLTHPSPLPGGECVRIKPNILGNPAFGSKNEAKVPSSEGIQGWVKATLSQSTKVQKLPELMGND